MELLYIETFFPYPAALELLLHPAGEMHLLSTPWPETPTGVESIHSRQAESWTMFSAAGPSEIIRHWSLV